MPVSRFVLSPNTAPAFTTQDRPIRADIVGDDHCTALGITAHGAAPVLKLCRLLVAAGVPAGTPLYAYRGRVLCLTVRTIREGATLTVDETCSAFAKWKAFPYAAVSPPVRVSGKAATTLAGAA